jgi:alkyl hydroperoxide reductase subunit AhpF
MAEQMLNDEIRKQVRELFGELDRPVEVLFFGSSNREECGYCEETQQLLSEVVDLSEKLSLRSFDVEKDADVAATYKIDGVPGYVMVGKDGDQLTDYGVRFKGISAGHEFSSLVNDLVLVSKRDSGLRPETRAYLKTLDKPVHLQVFVTPT